MTKGKDNTEPQKTAKAPARGWKKLLRALIIMGALIGVAQYVFYYYAFPILKEKICKGVTTKSQGLYNMDFDDIKINIIGQKIILENFSLKADTAVYLRRIEQEKYNKAIYNISVNRLTINHIGLKSFFSKNELYIKDIIMDEPVVRLVGKPDKSDKSPAKYDAVHTDLYPLLKSYFNSLNIRQIAIKNGFFDFHMRIHDEKQQFGISKIDIKLKNFYLDEGKFLARNQFFYSDVIEIGSNNYVINLADSMHSITAENLSIKTRDSSINAVNVKLVSNPQKNTQKNRFDVSLKKISISGLDISKAYFEKEVDLSKVTIMEPTIRFQKGGKVNKATKKFEASNDNWYSLIKGTLKKIAIDSFFIDGASMSFYKPQVNKKPIYSVGNVNIQMDGFCLDSLAHLDQTKILFSDNLSLLVNDYEMLLPDNRHQLTADNLVISTKTQILKAQKINIKPARYFRDSTEKTMRISIPTVELSGMDMVKAYNTQNYEIGKFKISLPDIQTRSFIDSAEITTGQHKHKAKLLEALSDEFFHSLKIRDVTIAKGKVNITSKASIQEDSLTLSGKLSLSIGNFVLNKATLSDEVIPFRTNSVKINLEDAVIKPSKSLHTLRCKNFSIDTKHDMVSVTDISYASDNDSSLINSLRRLRKHSLLDIKIDKTEFSKAELLNAIYHGEIKIEKLKITNPQFSMNLYPQLKRAALEAAIMEDTIEKGFDEELLVEEHDSTLDKFTELDRMIVKVLPKQLSLIKIDTLSTDSSVITFNIRDTSNNILTGTSTDFWLNVNGFYYNRDSVSPDAKFMLANSYNLDMNNFQFRLPDKTHIVKTGRISLNTSEGFLKTSQINIAPVRRAESLDTRKISLSCPEIKIVGADFATFNQSGILPIDSLVMNHSDIKIKLPQGKPNIKESKNESSAPKKNFNIIKGLSIGNVTSFMNKFVMERNTDSVPARIMNVDADFSCDNMSIDSSNIVSSGHLLHLENPYLDANNFMLKIKDNELTTGNVHLDNDTMNIHGTRFGHPTDSIKTNIVVPEVRITEPNLERLAFEHILDAHSINIDGANINLLSRAKKKEPSASQNHGKKKKFDFEIDSVTASNVCINLDRRFKDKPDLHFPNMDLLAVNINTDIPHESIYPAEKVTAGINNFTYMLKDSIYKFHFGRVELDPIHEVFTARHVDYRPTTGRYEFYNQFDYRRSATYVNCESMKGYGFNLINFIKTMKMDITKLDVDKFSFLSYENKSKPNDSTAKPNLNKYIFKLIPIKVKVDTTYISNSFMEIEQLSPEVGIPGILTVNDINGKLYNFTNDTADLEKNGSMLVTGNGKLMNQSKVSAAIRYDLDSPEEAFICNFMADTVYLPIFNPYLENGIFAHIDDGTLTKARIYFKSDDNESRGQSQFFYHDLKFSLNKKDSIQEKRRGLLSFLANTVLRTKNTRKIGYIYAKPDSLKGFTSYWLSSVLSGAKSTVGFENKEQKGDRKFYHKILDAVTRRNNMKEYILDIPEGDL